MKHYGRRLLAAGLSAAMVLGSVCSVSAQGRVADGSSGWNTSDVDNYTFSEDSSVTVTFENTPFQRDSENWSNFIIETVSTDTELGVTMRADAWSWTYGDATGSVDSCVATYSDGLFDDFATLCTENPTVTVTASMTSDTVAVFAIVWGNNVATETYTVTYASSVSEISFHVGTDGGIVEVTSVSYSGTGRVADGSSGWNTGDVDNYTFSQDTSVTVTFENTPFQRDSDVWSNFIIETVSTSTELGVTMRADAWSWTYGDATGSVDSCVATYSDGLLDDFATLCTENSTVTVTASMTSDTVAVFTIVWGDGVAYETYTVTYTDSVDEIVFHVGADGGTVATTAVSYSVIDFLGGSLRIDDSEDYTSTSLRFGYNMTLPTGATIVSATWAWGTDADSLTSFTPESLSYTENSDGTITSNLVITDITSDDFGTVIYSQISVTYKLADGTQITETEYAVQSRSVDDVATAISNSSSASTEETTYAAGILDN